MWFIALEKFHYKFCQVDIYPTYAYCKNFEENWNVMFFREMKCIGTEIVKGTSLLLPHARACHTPTLLNKI